MTPLFNLFNQKKVFESLRDKAQTSVADIQAKALEESRPLESDDEGKIRRSLYMVEMLNLSIGDIEVILARHT